MRRAGAAYRANSLFFVCVVTLFRVEHVDTDPVMQESFKADFDPARPTLTLQAFIDHNTDWTAE